MFSPILVAVAGGVAADGATREVGQAVAGILREHGHEVDVLAMDEVVSLDGYRAVVIGALLVSGRWHRDARPFLLRHHQALVDRPVAVFACGSDGPGEVGDGRHRLLEELAKYPWLHPIGAEMFVGMGDGDEIGAWAHAIARTLWPPVAV